MSFSLLSLAQLYQLFTAYLPGAHYVWVEILGHGLISTVFGIIIGIPAALWVDRRIKGKEEAAEYKKERQREKDVLLLLKEELEFSKQGLDIRKTNPSQLHIQPLKTDLWEAMSASGMLTLIESPELLNRISSAYYALRIVRRIEEACYAASRGATVTFSNGRTGAQVLLADAQGFYELLENNLVEAVEKLNQRISQLASPH